MGITRSHASVEVEARESLVKHILLGSTTLFLRGLAREPMGGLEGEYRESQVGLEPTRAAL